MVYRKPESTLPSMMPLQRNVISRFNQPSRPVFTAASMLQQPLTSTSQISDAQNMYASQGLQAGALKAAQPAQSTADLLRSYGLGVPTAPQAAATPAPLRTARAATGLSGMLPAAGTPEMAGLGAAGRTLMQLGGYQKEPMTFGQILGIGAEKGLEAMQARRDAIAAAEEKEAAAKRQSMLDAITLGEFNIKRRKAAREEADAGQPTKPYEIYDVQTGRKRFVRDVRTKDGGWTTEDVGGVAAEKEKTDKIYGQRTVYDTQTKKAISVAENDPRIQLGGEFLDNDRYRVANTPQAAIDAADIGLSDKLKNELTSKTFNFDAALDQVNEIKRLYRDEYLIVPEKIGFLYDLGAEKYFARKIPEKDKKMVDGFVRIRQTTNTMLNDYVRAMTGAQMSVAEVGRLENAIPIAGTGLFDGDSPTMFRSKLEQFERLTKMARARATYALKNGYQEVRNDEGKFMGWSKEGERPLSMDRMFGILVKERKELADKILSENEDFNKEQAEAEAQKAIEERYGINV